MSFRPARWLPNGHTMTIFSALVRRPPRLPTWRERWELLDREQEQEYLALIGRLRVVPNPGPALQEPGATGPGARRLPPADPQRLQRQQDMRQQMMEERNRRQRLIEERRRRMGFPGRRFPPRRFRRFEERPPVEDQETPADETPQDPEPPR